MFFIWLKDDINKTLYQLESTHLCVIVKFWGCYRFSYCLKPLEEPFWVSEEPKEYNVPISETICVKFIDLN